MIYFLLGCFLLFFMIIAFKYISSLSKESFTKFIKYLGIAILLSLILYLTLTGKLFAILGLLPLIAQFISSRRHHFTHSSSNATSSSKMSKKEAFDIFDLPQTATKAEIKKRYHKLMLTSHPDKGGSTFLASKINEAYKILMQK